MTTASFVDRLDAAGTKVRSLLCVGLDVDPAAMPVTDVAEFNRAIVDATGDLACAYKPNLAFYEVLGIPGWQALEATVAHIRAVAPHAIIIGDNKLGDIGFTASAYARAMFDVLGFDAATINAWGGRDTVEPWQKRPDRGSFIWCRGSNLGSSEFQDLEVIISDDGKSEPLYLQMARRSCEWNTNRNLGLVVGATAPEQLAKVRKVCPDMPMLIPGIGAQGGDLEATVRNGVDAKGRNAIINSSRGIIYASSGPDYAKAARKAAADMRDAINRTLEDMGLGWR